MDFPARVGALEHQLWRGLCKECLIWASIVFSKKILAGARAAWSLGQPQKCAVLWIFRAASLDPMHIAPVEHGIIQSDRVIFGGISERSEQFFGGIIEHNFLKKSQSPRGHKSSPP